MLDCGLELVRKAGLEPAWLAPPPPQDGVSANSTTSALAILVRGAHISQRADQSGYGFGCAGDAGGF